MSGRITVITPEGRSEWALQVHNSLGRHPSNTVQVLDRIVSKEHCHIDLVDGRFVLKDLGSLNGTYVNGERCSERTLYPGDEITLGSSRVLFDASYPKPAGAEPGAPTAPQPDPATRPENPRSMPPVVGHPPPQKDLSKVTIAPGMVESHIRTKFNALAEQSFVPESMLQDVAQLRRDYEKLRVSYDLSRAIGLELDIDALLAKVLERAFELLRADRGVILMYDSDHCLQPRCVRTRKKGAATDEEVVLSTTILSAVEREKAAVLSNDASMDARFDQAKSIIMQGIRSTMAVPLLHGEDLLGVMVLDSQVAANAFQEKDLQLFQNVANQAAVAIQNSLYAKKIEEEALTRERFQRLLSPAIAEQVISGKVEVAKYGELRDTTVLFTDIRGFTSMSEARSAQEIVDMLNEYFELMVEIIFKYEGTLDKFVGDEIMALYGAPVAHDDDPARAVRTSLEMLEVLGQFNAARQAAGKVAVQIGIGVNSGEVVAGYLGSSKALEYTVIGDVVNTGARLCSAASAGQILISDSTYQRVKHEFVVEELPPIQVKGKAQALRVYSVLRAK